MLLHFFAFGKGDEVGEAGGTFPGFVVLREDEGEDGREFRGIRIVAEVVVPDANHIGKQTQSDEGVFFVLMLKEDVKEGRLAIDLRCKKKVA